MSEKKVVDRNVAIILGMICVILAVGLLGAVASYTSTINGKDNTISTKDSQLQTLTNQKNQLQTWLDGNKTLLNQTQIWLNGNLSQISSLNTQISNLQSQISSLNSQIYSLNSQITSLQNQIDSLKAAKLIEVNLKADDNRPWLQTPYLHVYGHVCNVGTNTAYNAILYVEAFQGAVLAFNTTISLGTISGESYTSIDSKIYYSGDALTEWHIWSKPAGINIYWFT